MAMVSGARRSGQRFRTLLFVLAAAAGVGKCRGEGNKTVCVPAEKEEYRPGKFAGGVVLAIFGSTGESLGLTIQKLSHDKEQRLCFEENRAHVPAYKRKLWWIGFVVFVIGNLMDFQAFAMTSQSIVTLVGCWALTVNLYTAQKILGEKRSWTDIGAGLVVMAGLGMAVGGTGGGSTKTWTVEELLEAYGNPGSVVLLTTLGAVAVGSYFIIRAYHRKNPLPTPPMTAEKDAALAAGNRLEYVKPMYPAHVKFFHVLISALVGTITVCTSKATSEMLNLVFKGCDGFKGTGFLIALAMVISLPLQIYFINSSLAINDALYHIPVFYVCWNVGSTVSGGVLYDEFSMFEGWNWALYIVGVLTLFGGVYIASKRLALTEANALTLELERSATRSAVGGVGSEDDSRNPDVLTKITPV